VGGVEDNLFQPKLDLESVVDFVTSFNEGMVLRTRPNETIGAGIVSNGYVKWVEGRKYRHTVRYRISQVPTNGVARLTLGLAYFNAEGYLIAWSQDRYEDTNALTYWSDIVREFTVPQTVNGETVVYWKPYCSIGQLVGWAVSDGRQQISRFALDDVTSESLAKASADIAIERAIEAGEFSSTAFENQQLAAGYERDAFAHAEAAFENMTFADGHRAAALEASRLASEYRDDAEDFAGSAGTSANIASEKSTEATQAASAARASAILSANVGQGALNSNPGFDDFPNATTGGLPTNWSADPTGTAGGYRILDGLGGYAYRLPAAAGANAYVANIQYGALVLQTNGYYTLEADILLNSGSLSGSGLLLRVYNSGYAGVADYPVAFSQIVSQTDTVAGAGSPQKAYQFRTMVRVTAADAAYFWLYLMTHWDGLGSIADPADITWLKCFIRPSTKAEIDAGVALPQIQSSISSLENVVATLDSSLAEQISTINTTLNGNSATINILTNSVNGLSAQWGVGINVNGLIGGVRLNGTGQLIAARWQVDQFTIEGTNGFKYFEATPSGVKLRGVEVDTIRAGVITADKIYNGAMGESAYVYHEAMVYSQGFNWVDVAAVAMTPIHGKPVRLMFSSLLRDITDANTKIKVRVIRDDGIVIYGGSPSTTGAHLHIQDEGTALTIPIIDVVDAGRATTWTLQMAKVTEENVTVVAEYRYAQAEEMSRVNIQSVSIALASGDGAGPGTGDGGGNWDTQPPQWPGGNPNPIP
jgi:hypothetical protein